MTRYLRIAMTVSALSVWSATSDAAPLLFDFTGDTLGHGSWGNLRTFEDGGITVTASAWGYTQGRYDNAFQTGALGQWDTGLGVCNRDEGSASCGSPQHQVDNVGADDWVLFVFSSAVNIDTVTIDPYGTRDRDVSYYVGNVTTPLNLAGATYAGLAGMGFQERRSSTASASSGPRSVDIAGGFVNAVLFGGYLGGSDQDDYFKIASIAAHTREVPPPPPAPAPEPGTLLMMLGGIGALAARRKMRREDHG